MHGQIIEAFSRQINKKRRILCDENATQKPRILWLIAHLLEQPQRLLPLPTLCMHAFSRQMNHY